MNCGRCFGGSTPSTLVLEVFSADKREAVRREMEARFHDEPSLTSGLGTTADALVVK
jgi:hypothetical protein